jgi:hypothetical protein
MTRRLWLALMAVHLAGLAAIFGGDALLEREAPPPREASFAAAGAFAVARDADADAVGGREVRILIELRHARERRGGGAGELHQPGQATCGRARHKRKIGRADVEEIAAAEPWRRCGDCSADMARRLPPSSRQEAIAAEERTSDAGF